MYQRRRECASIGEQLDRDGYMVIKDFLLPVECDEIIQAGQKLANDLPEQADRSIFSTIENDKQQLRDQHFLESNDKISYFFEKDAVGPTGDLQVHPSVSLNKLGHALHLLHPLFRCYTYCDRVQSLCRILGYKEPAVVQSMYIYKNPHIGAEVSPHQDGTYLYSSPIPVLGLWIALEDATVRNGCLWVVKGSHKSGLHRRLIRNPDKTGPMLIYDRPAPIYPQSSFIPIPVEKVSVQGCPPDEVRGGCKIYGSACICGVGCKTEYMYDSRRTCLSALRDRNMCYGMPCLRGICIQTMVDPGFACKCEGTGFYGQRCEKACPTVPMRGLVFPHECVVI